VEAFLQSYGYLGISLGIIATGIGAPFPEELPVVLGGVLVGHTTETSQLAIWWIMLPLCIVSVILGDSLLYIIGRLYGPRLLTYGWVQRRLLPPKRLEGIEANFKKYGVRILLFARVTPGIRAPIFVTAGLIRLPWAQFVLADAIYAVPGVSLLFFLGFWFGDSIVGLIHDVEQVKSIIVIVMLAAVVLYIAYRFLRKPVQTGDPKEMPPLVGPVTNTLDHVTTRIMRPITHHPEQSEPGVDGQARAAMPADPALPTPQGQQGPPSA
jgi:membrane protein DedA with SNARE-associated domain